MSARQRAAAGDVEVVVDIEPRDEHDATRALRRGRSPTDGGSEEGPHSQMQCTMYALPLLLLIISALGYAAWALLTRRGPRKQVITKQPVQWGWEDAYD